MKSCPACLSYCCARLDGCPTFEHIKISLMDARSKRYRECNLMHMLHKCKWALELYSCISKLQRPISLQARPANRSNTKDYAVTCESGCKCRLHREGAHGNLSVLFWADAVALASMGFKLPIHCNDTCEKEGSAQMADIGAATPVQPTLAHYAM